MSQLLRPLNPWHAAEQGLHISGVVDLTHFNRLIDLLVQPMGSVDCTLEFFVDAKRYHCVKGRIWGTLWQVCQRCLEPVEVKLDLTMLQAFARDDMAAGLLPKEYDPLVVTTMRICPHDIIEDEILLALPYVPMHIAEASCELADHNLYRQQALYRCGYKI